MTATVTSLASRYVPRPYRRDGVLALNEGARSLAAEVAGTRGFTLEALRQRIRGKDRDAARQHVMAALRGQRVSSAEIGRLLDRDPSTVCHGIAAHKRRHAH